MAYDFDSRLICFFVILAAAFALLLTEKLRNDLVAVLVILALAMTGILSPSRALSGFGSEPAIIIVSVFIMSGAIRKTGLTEAVQGGIGRLAGESESRALVVMMLAVALFSAFTHHVTTTALMLPVALSLCRERGIAASRVLMPMSFAASLGTTILIIGAPAFLIAGSVLEKAGRPGLALFSIAPIGLALTVAGIAYMLTAGRLLLPVRDGGEDFSNFYRLDAYFTEVEILPGSGFIGQTVAEITAKGPYRFSTVGWKRDGEGLCKPLGEEKLRAGDVLWVHANPEDMISFRQEKGIEVHPVRKFGLDGGPSGARDEELPEQLVQAVVAPQSDRVHRSLQEIDFKKRYGAVVLGLWRRGGFLCQEMASIKLQAGDVLVLEGDDASFSRVANSPAFLILAPFQAEMRLRGKARLAAIILLTTIAAAAFGLFRLDIVMLAGAAAMVLFGCITPRQAYRSVDAKIYVFLAGAIPLGEAMRITGAAALLAGWIGSTVQGWGPAPVLFLIYAVVAVTTQFMSDAAATALFAPVAVSLAQALGHAPEPYVITVAMSAVTAFLTPIGHHGNLLVYGPGRYRFSDFTRVGAPLTALIALVVVFMSLYLWPG